MKRYLLRYANLGTGFLLIIIVLFYIINPADNRKNEFDSLLRYTENEVINSLDSSLEANRFRKLKDSINRIIQWKNAQLSNGSGTYNIFFGLRRIDECDSCNSVTSSKKDYSSKYFFELGGFMLRNNTKFIIEKGKYYLIKPIKVNVSFNVSYYNSEPMEEKKEIQVRLAVPFFERKMTSLLIPLSERTGKILSTISDILMIITLIAGLYIFFVLPIRILVNIGNGHPFKATNHKYLKIIGWTILIITFIRITVPKAVEFFFRPMITDDIYNPFILSIFDFKKEIVSGFAILLLAKAFKKGYSIQKENDLTV